jgi:atypical dual specificity phosphatase
MCMRPPAGFYSYTIQGIMSVYEIVPRVWFGAAEYTFSPEFILNITHIVNCDDSPHSTNIWARSGRQFLHLRCEDNHKFQILQTYSNQLFEYIESALESPDSRVFIHCYMGINRSAALAIAYTARCTNTPAAQIIRQIRDEQRPILTNTMFEEQLNAIY